MGKKKYFDLGARGGKTDKAVEALKKYIVDMSKRERDQIEKELEQEGDSEEESPAIFKGLTFKNIKFSPTFSVPITWPTGAWTSPAATNPQKQEIEEDAQDVDFEE